MLTRKNKPQLNPALKKFWRTQADVKVLKGGRASSKTWDAAGIAVLLASKYSLRFLCIRQFQNRIKDSVYTVLKTQIERFGLEHEFDIQANTIKHIETGSDFSFYGMNKNTSEIKGFEGADICWIEEGEGLTAEQWEIIEPTMRNDGAECWLLYNPKLISDFAETFKHDPANGVIVRHINYDENPFLSKTMIRRINRMRETDFDRYCHIYLGQPLEDDFTQKVLSYSALKRCVEAFEKYKDQIDDNRLHGGLDVAENPEGDKNALSVRYGPILHDVIRWTPDPTKGPAPKAQRYVNEFGITKLYYDAGGIGAPLKRDFARFQPVGRAAPCSYLPFLFGGAVEGKERPYIKAGKNSITNGEYFHRVNSQAWWNIRHKVENTIDLLNGEDVSLADCLFINPDIKELEELLLQLSTATYEETDTSKIKINKRGDGETSPDMADSVVMAFLFDIRKGLKA